MKKVVLFDADSIIYQAVHKIISFGEIRNMYYEGHKRFEIESEILQRSYDRFDKICMDIINEIEMQYNVKQVLYFFTKCSNNFRKKIDSEYKANRKKRSKWVSELRNYLLEYYDNSFAHDEYEADDLIYYHTQMMEVDEYIICAVDKDLRQIEGLHFNYYQLKLYDEDGVEYKIRKGFKYMTKEECDTLICELLLIGDSADNIKGVKGIGQVKAKRLLENKKEYGKFMAVCRAYANECEFWKEKLRMNYSLIKFQ